MLELDSINLGRYSQMEHGLVERAAEELGDHFRHSSECLDLLFDFLEAFDTNRSMAFIPFLAQTQMSMLLAVLSCLRRHDVQTQVMLRSALEAAQIGAYGIGHDNPFLLGKFDERGVFQPRDKPMDIVGPWLTENVPTQARVILEAKKEINRNGAHAGLATTRYTFDVAAISILPFDADRNEFTELRLAHIASLCLTIVQMYVLLLDRFPIASVKIAAIERLDMLTSRQTDIVRSLAR